MSADQSTRCRGVEQGTARISEHAGAGAVAKRIRMFVNSNPRLKDIIQFNAAPGLLGAGLISERLNASSPKGREER